MSTSSEEILARPLLKDDIQVRIDEHLRRIGLENTNKRSSGKPTFASFEAKKLWDEITERAEQNRPPGLFVEDAEYLIEAFAFIWKSGSTLTYEGFEGFEGFVKDSGKRDQLQYRLRCCIAGRGESILLRNQNRTHRRSGNSRVMGSVRPYCSSISREFAHIDEGLDDLDEGGQGRASPFTPEASNQIAVCRNEESTGNSQSVHEEAFPAQRTNHDSLLYEDPDNGFIATPLVFNDRSTARKRTHEDGTSQATRRTRQFIGDPGVEGTESRAVNPLSTVSPMILPKKALKALTSMLRDGKPGIGFANLLNSVDELDARGETDMEALVARAFPDEDTEIVEAFHT
ncbi:hypothetical protein K491DRAFT_721110 [Lophiostoma macrostomum CBS 122681]|uniref:Uncharacterized protein n=1 Tax=Lophiostoma macrostomum CBS 122681 TaxID=1314788 RepID=A0A6A6SSR3_9PLEO|nr:hypothetical protein K491DRAFT_721110 [Lophiostoma macrostomum CBS 122681]